MPRGSARSGRVPGALNPFFEASALVGRQGVVEKHLKPYFGRFPDRMRGTSLDPPLLDKMFGARQAETPI